MKNAWPNISFFDTSRDSSFILPLLPNGSDGLADSDVYEVAKDYLQ